MRNKKRCSSKKKEAEETEAKETKRIEEPRRGVETVVSRKDGYSDEGETKRRNEGNEGK